MSRKTYLYIFLAISLFGVSACQKYQVTLNDQPVYQPPKLLERMAFADPALETCVEQTILDGKITAVKQITRLRCTSAGIRSLSGLEQLVNLAELDFSSNAIAKIDSLFQLQQLKLVRLSDNSELDCEQLQNLKKKIENLATTAPAHCESNN